MILLLACNQPIHPLTEPATEIGNPEMTMHMRADTAAPSWIGFESDAVLFIDRGELNLSEIVLSDCDGVALASTGTPIDLLQPSPLLFEAPREFCGVELRLAPGGDDDVSALFGGIDSLGRPFEVTDRRFLSIPLTVEAQDGGDAFVFSVDLSIWLEAISLLGRMPDADGVVRISDTSTLPLAGAAQGSVAVFGDADADGEVVADDTRLVPAARVPDRDGDGLRDDDEIAQGLDPDDADSDGDSLADGEESRIVGTNATHPDSDGDGVDDGTELRNGTDPLVDDNACCDLDGDGHFSPGHDCDDSDPTVHPGANDPAGDGIDQNCDGLDG